MRLFLACPWATSWQYHEPGLCHERAPRGLRTYDTGIRAFKKEHIAMVLYNIFLAALLTKCACQTFIIIFADDFGFDSNSFGSQTTSTPNLDKLASQVRRVNTTETSSGQLLPVVGHEADATLLRPFDLLSEQSGSWDWWSPCSASRLLWWSAREWNDYRGATEIEGICNDDDWKMASGTVEIVNDFSRLLMFLFSLSCGYWYRCFP